MTTLPIILSTGFVPIVKLNDIVKIGQELARKESGTAHVVNLFREFSTSSDKIRKTLLIKPGDTVKPGDVLAVKKNFLGLNGMELISRVNGIISRYERESGNLVITDNTKTNIVDIISPVDGKVSLCDNDKIVVTTDKDVYAGRKSMGDSIGGEAFVMDGALLADGQEVSESELSLYYSLDSRAVGKIVVGRKFSRDLLIKCIGMGVIGIIGSEIRDEDLEYITSRDLDTSIIETDNDIIEKIIKWKGKKFYLNIPEKTIIVLHA